MGSQRADMLMEVMYVVDAVARRNPLSSHVDKPAFLLEVNRGVDVVGVARAARCRGSGGSPPALSFDGAEHLHRSVTE
eukprot:7316258-Pyramimonas_sp.AAC.1